MTKTNKNYFQKYLCTPVGLDCYETVDFDSTNCLPRCEGLFADVDQKPDIIDFAKNMANILGRYEEYRRGFDDDPELSYKNFVIESMF